MTFKFQSCFMTIHLKFMAKWQWQTSSKNYRYVIHTYLHFNFDKLGIPGHTADADVCHDTVGEVIVIAAFWI